MKNEQPPVLAPAPDKDLMEKEIPTFSKTEFERLQNIDVENPDDIRFMEEKGISFDMGDIIIEIDGKKEMMTTRKNDFGTLLAPKTIEELYKNKEE